MKHYVTMLIGWLVIENLLHTIALWQDGTAARLASDSAADLLGLLSFVVMFAVVSYLAGRLLLFVYQVRIENR